MPVDSRDGMRDGQRASPVLWATGEDLAVLPTPGELCAIALVLKANFADNLAPNNPVSGVTLRAERSEPQFGLPAGVV